MKQLKKHAIGYNTVSSTDGIISARGVKSYPNDLQIFGYTHEIGEGEKSPDNPYLLESLDSGNVNLYSEDKITDIVISNEGAIRKGISIEASRFKSKNCCVYFNLNESVGINQTHSLNIKFLYKNGKYEAYANTLCITSPKKRLIPSYVEKILIYESINDTNDNFFKLYKNLAILDSPIMPGEYITDEHSIVLSNNDATMQIPTPIALNCVDGVSDYIYKDIDGVWKLVQKYQKYEFTGKENFAIQSTNSFGIVNFLTLNLEFKRASNCVCSHLKQQKTLIANTENEGIFIGENNNLFLRIHKNRFSTVNALKTYLAEQYQSNAPITLVYYLYTPITHILSDYSQQLLNSFELQNQNNIFIEGYPTLKVSGYIQK